MYKWCIRCTSGICTAYIQRSLTLGCLNDVVRDSVVIFQIDDVVQYFEDKN